MNTEHGKMHTFDLSGVASRHGEELVRRRVLQGSIRLAFPQEARGATSSQGCMKELQGKLVTSGHRHQKGRPTPAMCQVFKTGAGAWCLPDAMLCGETLDFVNKEDVEQNWVEVHGAYLMPCCVAKPKDLKRKDCASQRKCALRRGSLPSKGLTKGPSDLNRTWPAQNKSRNRAYAEKNVFQCQLLANAYAVMHHFKTCTHGRTHAKTTRQRQLAQLSLVPNTFA
eukprot:282808-Pelagomonas_calceolata.AAC.3